MRILVSNNHLHTIGGTEMWTYTMCKALHAAGHDVEWFTFNRGVISSKLIECGIYEQHRDSYDLILANHQPTIKKLYGLGPIIQTSHGLLPICMPHPLSDFYAAVSPRVIKYAAKYIVDNVQEFAPYHPHPPELSLILNGIDCDLYMPNNPVHKHLTTVLSLCQSEEANQLIQTACERLGITLLICNKNVNPELHIYNTINKADLVIGWGRSIYDAMACGRPVISFDIRGYASGGLGYLTESNISSALYSSCTGIDKVSIPVTIESLTSEMSKYNMSDGEWCREFALEHLNVTKQIQKYFNIAGVK